MEYLGPFFWAPHHLKLIFQAKLSPIIAFNESIKIEALNFLDNHCDCGLIVTEDDVGGSCVITKTGNIILSDEIVTLLHLTFGDDVVICN